MNTNVEQVVVSMISSAGVGKSCAFEAVFLAKEGKFKEAREMIEQGEKELLKGSKEHAKLLAIEANEGLQLTLLVVHASNHLSNAELSLDFAKCMIDMYEEKSNNV